MLHLQVRPDTIQAVDYSEQIDAFLEQQRSSGDMAATRHQLDRLPEDLRVLSGVRAVLPALVYLPNKLQAPPSLAIGEAEALNSEFLHSRLKTKVRQDQKSREFRNSPVTSAILADDLRGRHLFLDDDSEDAPKHTSEENKELYKKLYNIDNVYRGDEFGEAGLSLVGLIRVIGGARQKAELKREPEDSVVDRFLLETFAALARSGKSSEVYARLVQENSGYRKAKNQHPSGAKHK